MRFLETIIVAAWIAVVGCSQPVDPATVRVGQEFAAAERAARDAGYVLHDASQLAMVPAPLGFYLNLPGDRGLIVARAEDDTVGSLELCENWGQGKAARVYHSIESFEISPTTRRE